MLGKNIKYYRLLNGMSQEALAQGLGVNKMAVSNYENDKRRPDLDTIRRMADLLHVPMARLLAKDNSNLSIQHGAFRKHSGTSQTVQALVLGCLDRYLSRFYTLVGLLGEAALAPAPEYEKVTVTDCEAAAQYLRRVLNLPPTGPIGNITDILENNGFIVCPVDIDTPHFSGNNGTVNGRPYIAVNIHMSAERQRFTLIHELAHIVFTFAEDADEERMVDSIAGAFLLPAQDIKRELGVKRKNICNDLRYVQQEYQISMASIVVRAYQTGIITKETYEITNKWLSAHGYRTNEQSGIQPEKSCLLEQLTIRAVAEEEIGVSKAAELLQLPLEEARKLCYGGV